MASYEEKRKGRRTAEQILEDLGIHRHISTAVCRNGCTYSSGGEGIKLMMRLFKNKEMRNRIIITLVIMLLYRYGCSLLVPGISTVNLLLSSTSFFGMMNMLGGGALSRFSVFALGVNPYITASIIIELMTIVIPVLDEWRQDGQKGMQKIEKATRYLSVILAILQAFSITYQFDRQYGIMQLKSASSYMYVIAILTAGSMILVWLGDQITVHGIGNGISLLIFAGIVAELPSTFTTTFSSLVGGLKGQKVFSGVMNFTLFVLLYLAIIFLVLKIETAERRIPIKSSRGSAFSSGSNLSYLPIKVNSSGVIPIIFAQSIMTVPLMIISFISIDTYKKVDAFVSLTKVSGIVIYAVLVFLFTFFYADTVVDPEEISDNFRKSGTFIPGIRPGKDTQKYLRNILYSTTFTGAVSLTAIAVLPYILTKVTSLTSAAALGGTGIIVAVSVALETIDMLKAKYTELKYKRIF